MASSGSRLLSLLGLSFLQFLAAAAIGAGTVAAYAVYQLVRGGDTGLAELVVGGAVWLLMSVIVGGLLMLVYYLPVFLAANFLYGAIPPRRRWINLVLYALFAVVAFAFAWSLGGGDHARRSNLTATLLFCFLFSGVPAVVLVFSYFRVLPRSALHRPEREDEEQPAPAGEIR